MDSKIVFIYDGECPFCNHFAELIELKSGIPDIEIRNARKIPNELPKSYDIDINGAILLVDKQMFFGASAINLICTKMKEPSDSLMRLLKVVFSNSNRSKALFPILLIARRITLFLKGKPRKITS